MRLRFQGLKNPAAVATTAGMLINGHISDLGFARIVQVQSATGDGLAGRIEKQEVKSGSFGRIALAPARLAPGSTQDPPAQIEVKIPIGGGTGAAKN